MKHSRTTIAVASADGVFPALTPAGEQTPAALPASGPSLAQLRTAGSSGQLKGTVLGFETIGDHGNLLVNYLRARKETFIDRLQWQLPHADGMEFDQYDTPQCRWVIVHEFGEILGGVRLLPVDMGI